MMFNWIQINGLSSDLTGLDKTTLRRAFALACENPDAAYDVVERENAAGRSLPNGLRIDPMGSKDVGTLVAPAVESEVAPAVFVLLVEDPKVDLSKATHVKGSLSCAPIVILALTQSARNALDDLHSLKASIQALGFEKQEIKWVEICDRADGTRPVTWPRELGSRPRNSLRASEVRRSTARDQVAFSATVLDLFLDAPWCWKEKPKTSSRSAGANRPFGDEGHFMRKKLLEVIEKWLSHDATGPKASVTIVATERGVDPDRLHPDLAELLAPGASDRVFWMLAPQLDPIETSLAALSDALLGAIKSDLVILSQAQSDEGLSEQNTPAGEGDALRAYKALVDGQSQSLNTIRPPDVEAMAKSIIEDAEIQTLSYTKGLVDLAEARLRLERVAPAIMARLAASRTKVISETGPETDGGRQKVSDRQAKLSLTEEAQAEIAGRVRDVVAGLALGHAHLLRLHWLRNLRPRYTDQIKSQLGDPSANPRLPVLENVHQTYPPIAKGPETHIKTLVERIRWPEDQSVPHWSSLKQLKAQYRKFNRFTGYAIGLVVLVGLGGAAVSDGLNAHLGRDAVVRNTGPDCPSSNVLWSVPVFANNPDPSQAEKKSQLEDQQKAIIRAKITEKVASEPEAMIDKMVDATLHGRALSLAGEEGLTPSQIFEFEARYTELQFNLAGCAEEDEKLQNAAGQLRMAQASDWTQTWYMLRYAGSLFWSPLFVFALLLVVLTVVPFAVWSMITGLKDQKVDKLNGIEKTTSKAVQTELMASFSEWKAHLEHERKAFVAQFAEQVRATLHKRGLEATSSFETVETYLSADVAKAQAAIKSLEEAQSARVKRKKAAQDQLSKNLKKALPSGMRDG